MSDLWDGTERRTPVILAEQLRPKNTVEVPIVIVLVGFAAMLLLQASAIWGHGVIAQNQRKILEGQDRFACYVVRTTQGQPEGVLTDCGFLNLGTKR